MFEKFLGSSSSTFQQRYLGTYGFFHNRHEKKPPLLVKLVDFPNNLNKSVVFQTIEGISYELKIDTEKDIGFEFAPPEKRWYPHQFYGAVLGCRRPSRQYSKGLCDANYKVCFFKDDNISVTIPINFEVAATLLLEVEPKHTTLAFNKWVGNDALPRFYYLNKQFCIAKKRGFPFAVYLYDQIIGTFTLVEDVLHYHSVDVLFSEDCRRLANILGYQKVIYE